MATDGPADPNPDGSTAADSEGSIFDRLKSPTEDAPDAGSPSGTAAGVPVTGHDVVDSSAQNAGVVAASHEAAGLTPISGAHQSGSGATDSIATYVDDHVEDRDPAKERAAERLVAAWFTLTVLSVIAFALVFVYGQPHREYYSPALGGTMGLALFSVGVGAVLWAKKLMPEEEAVQEREHFYSPPAESFAAADSFRQGVAQSGIAERPLLRRSLLGAMGALGVLALVTLRSLGPVTSNQAAGQLARTSWRKGLRMIDTSRLQAGELDPFARPEQLQIGSFITVIPEGTADDEQAQADSVAMLIRLRPDELHPVEGRGGLDYDGYVVYSKLCSHLGCPVSLYEQQTHKLLCPCHQSQFLATESARPVFGPASRRLPQLALDKDSDGYFIARDGDFPEPVGPGYWERT